MIFFLMKNCWKIILQLAQVQHRTVGHLQKMTTVMDTGPCQKPVALVWCAGCVDCSNWTRSFQGGESTLAHLQGELGAPMT
ncbi:hypothetical protein EK904_013543 [Melospiza melodia maxima]|nr:hypothetical protein EK904_013543 [Melospiza melodia maxima]